LVYAIGRDGVASLDIADKSENLHPLFDIILEKIPSPSYQSQAPFQMLISDLGYSDYMGRLAIGRIFSGSARFNDNMVCINEQGEQLPLKISKLQIYQGLELMAVDKAEPGDIVVLSGIEDVKIGDTICTKSFPIPLKRISVDEPTISMKFTINRCPFSGTEGRFLQSAKIYERLRKETLKNVAIKVETTDDRESFIVKGRGEFQLAILIETMRREGFEICVGRPEVIFQYRNGKKFEPIEQLFVDCDGNFLGIVTEKLSLRKALMTNLVNKGSGRVRIEFSIPSRSLIGYRDEFLTDTKGTGIMNSLFSGYEGYRGDFQQRFTGSIVSDRNGSAIAYALFHLEPRGRLFIVPGDLVYRGMIIGEHNKDTDIHVNPCKEKKLSNMRAAGKDENTVCSPIKPMTLEQAINFIRDDEMVEITPKSVRLHKDVFSMAGTALKKASNHK